MKADIEFVQQIQSNEEDRVPAVPAWGPPSIPNTPVIGRHSQPSPSNSQQASPSESQPSSRKISTSSLSSQVDEQQTATKPIRPSRKSSTRSPSTMIEVHQPPEAKGGDLPLEKKIVPGESTTKNSVCTGKILGNTIIGGVDSGFSTPCTRTPSPNMDTITSAK